jgi:MFS family permease
MPNRNPETQRGSTDPPEDSEDREKSLADANGTAVAHPMGELPPLAKPQEPYHVFTLRQKWGLMFVIGTAGLFSGLSSNIYFPAQDQISQVSQPQLVKTHQLTAYQDLHVSLSLVSLTITSYLVIQGISPVLWGSLADTLGRRPIYIASFLVYIIANIGLSFSPNFAVLLLFRGLQAAGSASTVSIGE